MNKPCPFCGKPVDLTNPDTLHPSGVFWRMNKEIGFPTYHGITEFQDGDESCYVLHCVENSGGCGVRISGDSIDEVLQKWNTRTEEK